MYRVPNTSVARWKNYDGIHSPAAVDMLCPSCRQALTFTEFNWNHLALRGSPLHVRCPRCGDTVTFIRLGGNDPSDVRLFVDAEQPARAPLAGLDDLPDDVFGPALKRVYTQALAVLAIGQAEATAVTCRKLLEGIVGGILGQEPGVRPPPLASQIRSLSQENERLSKPLLELADALREGGNLGAHFDLAAEPTTVPQAEQMVALVEFLITYLYVIPAQIHEFHRTVLGKGADPEP